MRCIEGLRPMGAGLAGVFLFGYAPTVYAQEVEADGSDLRYSDRLDSGDRAREPSIAVNAARRFVPRIKLGEVGSFRPVLHAQLRVDVNHEFGEAPQTEATIRLRKLRTGFKIDLFNERLQITGRISLAPGSLGFVDGYVDWIFDGHNRLRVGVTDVPFTRYGARSSSLTAGVDDALVTDWFSPGYQLGVMATDQWEGNVHYAAGIFTGQDTMIESNAGLADFYGQEVRNMFSFTNPDTQFNVHPELMGMIGWGTPDMGAPRSYERQGGPWRYAVALSAAVDTKPEPTRDLAAQIAPEVELRGRFMHLHAVGYFGFAAPPSGKGAWKFGVVGALTELTWNAHRWVDVFALWSGVWWNRNLAQWAQTQPGHAIEVGGGLGIPIVGDQLKWVNDVRFVSQGVRGGPQQRVVWRSQAQIAF